MSLDVNLEVDELTPTSGADIFIREDGQSTQVSREEWDERLPGVEPTVFQSEAETRTVHDGNITHNLEAMANEAGIYKHLWRPDEIGITRARELIEPLNDGLALLRSDIRRFEAHNPSNGWGNYEVLVKFVDDYLSACREYPDARIRISR